MYDPYGKFPRMEQYNVSGKTLFIYGDDLEIIKADDRHVLITGSNIGFLLIKKNNVGSTRYETTHETNTVMIDGRNLKVRGSGTDYIVVDGEIMKIKPYFVEGDEVEIQPLRLGKDTCRM
jgi:archaellum component FlaG (FlaF/FlaG flagellin family)